MSGVGVVKEPAATGLRAGNFGCCGGTQTHTERAVPVADPEALVSKVRDRYSEIAQTSGSCCGSECGSTGPEMSTQVGYRAEDLASAPEEANLGLGCGAPLAHLALQPGETVLDLGSGPGLDAFLAARAVGPTGRVIGVDMTPAMIERSRATARRAGYETVEFREGRLESMPVEDASVDAVTSNCVINLVPDKAAVFREIARVLKPGGRMVVSDIVIDGTLPDAVARDLAAWVGCVAGAMPRHEYLALLEEAGLRPVEIVKDDDYGLALEAAAPEEARALLERTGVAREEVVGRARSITVRAFRPL